ncbi:hypothetical protein [Okeania sp. SIO3I5]|uniref:hypothetical protein n=1 Tax=Okeania sp. SIO3I5 TaxID=2607805 RepID=UPI0025F574E3|nr:hypothetical protein [Okeania sp. SIO3I5]
MKSQLYPDIRYANILILRINMIVLDTNVVSELMKFQGSLVVRQWVAARPINNLFTTTITQAEILYS